MKGQLYLDLDGVLADFDKAASAIVGMYHYKFEFVYGADEFWKRMHEVPDVFSTFEPMPDAFELWNQVKERKPIILTALPKTGAEAVDRQKREWVKRIFGHMIPVVTCRSHEKAHICSPGDVLVDDRALNKRVWESRGGHFILHTSAVNTVAELGALA